MPSERIGILATAWFPAGEWPKAIERWPDLLEDMPENFPAYCHAIEAKAKMIDAAMPQLPKGIAPLTVDGLVAYSEEQDLDPNRGEARSGYAAELARTGGVRPWPPGRNDPCWCGSGQKYKRCCGPIPPAQPKDD